MERLLFKLFILLILSPFIVSCASMGSKNTSLSQNKKNSPYASRLPDTLATSERTIYVDPKVHAWGAYDSSGKLVGSGLASAGAKYCNDIKAPCKTDAGTFRIGFIGNEACKSSMYPLAEGGAPMPYCMFFNGTQAIHGSPNVVEGNISHGCVRVRKGDALWLRNHFAESGTKVVIAPY